MIPTSVEKRKVALNLLERYVQLLREVETLKEDMIQLKQEAEEVLGKDFSKHLPKLAKGKIDGNRIEERANKDLELLAEIEILENIKLTQEQSF